MDYRTFVIDVDSYSGTSSVRIGQFKADNDHEAKMISWKEAYYEDELDEDFDVDEWLEDQETSDTRIETIINLSTGKEIFDLGTGMSVSIENWN